MAAPLLLFFSNSSRHYSLIKPLSPHLHIPIVKRYSRRSSSSSSGEKATSTAEEFQRVAAEKRKQQGLAPEKAGQGGVVSQTADKPLEASHAEVFEDSQHDQIVDEKYKEKDPQRKDD